MKIALVSPYDYAIPGGVSTHIYHLAEQFGQMGHQVKIIAPCSDKTTCLNAQGVIPIGRVTPISHNGAVAAITMSCWLMPRVRSTLREEEFDIIHLHEPACPLLPWMVLFLSDTINVGSFHAYYEASSWYWLGGKSVLKLLLRRLHGRIAVSEPARECVNRYHPNDYHLIPNGIDFDRFSKGTSPIAEFNDGKLNILFVGRLEERKGVSYLLEAYEQVKREYPNSRLIIAGPGNANDRHDYEQGITRKGIKDVIFVGYVPQDELPRYYHTADIFCSPATGRESFGIVLLEAMASGKPVIASQIAGYSQLVTSGEEGLLVPPKDEVALAKAIGSLLDNQSLRQEMGAKGKQKAGKYGWENVAQQTMDYYLQLIARERGQVQ